MYYRESDFDIVDRVLNIAARHSVSAAQVALAWLLHQPVVTAPVVGVRSIKHLEESVGALEMALSENDLSELEDPYQAHPILGHE